MQSPANIGGLCRLMDAFNLNELWLCNAQVDLNSARLKRTARSAERSIKIHSELTLEEVLEPLATPANHIIALELTTNSLPISKLQIPTDKPIILLLGGEQHGISEYGLSKAANTYHIPMYGSNSSMNVIQAASIGLYCLTQKLL